VVKQQITDHVLLLPFEVGKPRKTTAISAIIILHQINEPVYPQNDWLSSRLILRDGLVKTTTLHHDNTSHPVQV